MAFSLAGFDQWTFRIVMFGSLVVLEAFSNDEILSTVLEPMDSTRARAHELINRPCCALATAHA